MKAGRTQKNRRRIKETKPMPGDYDDDDDPYSVPQYVMRLAADVSSRWRRCHRPACKRGRACRGVYVQCDDERPPRKPSTNPEKDQRDEARAWAKFQRMLREREAALAAEAVRHAALKPPSQTQTSPRESARKRRK